MATITSIQNGNWEDTSTWSGGVVPTVGDRVVINNGDEVILNSNIDVGDGSTTALYVNDGTLKFNRVNDITVEVTGRMQVDANGVLDLGKENDPCLGNIKIQLNKTGIASSGAYWAGAMHIFIFGKVRTTNSEITNVVGSVVTVNDSSGWEIGDELCISRIDSRSLPHYTTISSINGNDITLSSLPSWNILSECPIGNATKNIVIEQHPNITTPKSHLRLTNLEDNSIVNIQHFQLNNLRDGTTNFQGALNLQNNGKNRDVIIKDIIFTGDQGFSGGVDINNYRDSTGIYENWGFMFRSGQYTIRTRSGATIELKNSVLYDGGQMISSWSQGSSGMILRNCKILQRRLSSSSIQLTGISYNFIDCIIACNNVVGTAINVLDIGLLKVENCEIGKTTGNWNITYNRFFDSAANIFQQNVESNNCILNLNTGIVDNYGSSGLENASSTSYYFIKNPDNTKLNEVHVPDGIKKQINSIKVLGEKSIEFENSNNARTINQIYKTVIPSGVNVKVSGFYRINSNYTSVNKPQIKVTSNSGINEVSILSGSVDTWHSFEIDIVQNSGSDEEITIIYSADANQEENSYLDCINLSSYGYTNITSFEPEVSNLDVTLIGSISKNSLVTQDESTASSHTGISIDETPITWNSKNFEITITGNLTTNPNLTLEDIQHYLYYNFNRIYPFEGRNSGFLWEDILPLGRSESVAFESRGVRIIDENGNPFPGVTRMQSNDSTYYIAPTIYNASTSGIFSGSRLQVYNLTRDTEILNEIVTSDWSLDYEEGINITEGDTIRIRVTYANGTSYKKPFETTVVAGQGFSALIDQEDWIEVESLGIDGSTISEFSTDFVNIQIDMDDSDGQTTKTRLISWYAYILFSSAQGIANFFGGIEVEDAANYRINVNKVNLKLENGGVNNITFTDTNTRLYTSDGSSLFADTGNSIFMESGKVYVNEVDSKDVTKELTNIKTLLYGLYGK